MSETNNLELDDTIRTAWAASEPASGHLDEPTWTALLEGRLDQSVRESALDHISACARCAGVFKAARTAALAEVGPAATVPASRHRAGAGLHIPRFAALAATVAVAAIGIVVLRQNGAPVQPAIIAPSAPVAPTSAARIEKPAVVVGTEQLLAMRGSGDNAAFLAALAAALEPYNRDEFGEAARRLAEVDRDHPDVFEPVFYLGVSLLLDGRPQEAVPVLERALALVSPGRRDDAARFLALARERTTPR